MDDKNNPINDEFLLKCMPNYKPLYDKPDKGYKSAMQQENCWASVARSLHTTLIYEPTDAAVATKPFQTGHYKAIKIMTPNLNELKEISSFLNIKHTNSSNLEDVAEMLKEMLNYVDNTIVTLGSRGILVARKALATEMFLNEDKIKEIYVRHYPASKITKLVNVSGAGDCFISGFIAALTENKSEEICVSVGFAAARLALQAKGAVPESIFDKSHESWNIPAKYKSIL